MSFLKRLFRTFIKELKNYKRNLNKDATKIDKQKIIFVIGTGRSGTHWLGFILQNHSQIKGTIEKPEIFSRVTEIALDPSKQDKLYPTVVELYKNQLARFSPFHYVDKSHPNLWLAAALRKDFQHAHFIGILRNPYATVSSMLQHTGVLRWSQEWERFPVPNKFLGITEKISKIYEDLPLTEKCTLRWIAHYKELNRLETLIGDRLLIIDYEELVKDTGAEIHRITTFLKLPPEDLVKEIRNDSLDKWRNHLSCEDKKNIHKTLLEHGIEEYESF